MPICFVCMPLIDDLKPLFEDAIKVEVHEALGEHWCCVKADDQRRPGMVTEKIVNGLLNADLVIAIVADTRAENSINPNVMYELGVAHCFRKPTLLIADTQHGLPFDLRAVETIQIEFSRYKDPYQRHAVILELRQVLRASLCTPETLGLDRRRVPVNPITAHLSGTRIFIEDLPWLRGYCAVLERELKAKTIWEITRDLFWPSEPTYFESIKLAIRSGKKHYFMIPESEEVLRKAETIRKQLQLDLPAPQIDELLRFVAIDRSHFALWPIPIVLYDADLATSRGGILCEPMMSEVGHDGIDEELRELFAAHIASGKTAESFLPFCAGLDWIKRKQEKTFDIALDGRVVDSLANAFAKIWNEKIRQEAMTLPSDQGQALLTTWQIRG